MSKVVTVCVSLEPEYVRARRSEEELTPSWAKLHDKIMIRVRAAPELNGGSDLGDLWIIDLADPANPTNLTQTPDV